MAIHTKDVLAELHEAETGVTAFNRKLGIGITGAVSTMWCAYYSR